MTAGVTRNESCRRLRQIKISAMRIATPLTESDFLVCLSQVFLEGSRGSPRELGV